MFRTVPLCLGSLDLLFALFASPYFKSPSLEKEVP